jgi:hypothetical protein
MVAKSHGKVDHLLHQRGPIDRTSVVSLRQRWPLSELVLSGVQASRPMLAFAVNDEQRVCRSRLHLLSEWFQLLSRCSDPCLVQFYDPSNNCFRQVKLNQFIVNILEPVKDFDFAHLEPALLKGLAGV